jgi:hypothetical protein
MNRRKRAAGRHVMFPRCEPVPMVSDSTREHDRAHDRHDPHPAAEERSTGSARRPPRACARRARTGSHPRARHPRKSGTTWRRRLRSGPRRHARIPGRCAIRRRVTAVGSVHNSTGRRSRFARGCSRADDRSTKRWLTERVLCGHQRWRCVHGSSSPAVAGSNWRPVSSGSSRKQSDRFLRAPSPYPFRDGRSWQRKRPCSASQPVCATSGRCTREAWRCCRGCSAMAAVPRTTRMAEARCAMPSERSLLRLTVNGVHDGGPELGRCSLRHRRARIRRRELRRITRHRLGTSAWRLGTLGPHTGWRGEIERERVRT